MGDWHGFEPRHSFFDQERLSDYRPGGYHPVSLGDRFKDGRYKVYHKLGWGGFSTVWLAKDNIRDEWVAVKILAAHSDEEKSAKEIGILRELCVDPRSNDDDIYVVQLLDEFFHEGPNGRHQCLVLELLGPSLDSVIKSCNPSLFSQEQTADDSIDPNVIFRVSKKLLGALDTLHAKGIAHGDVSAHNIAFTASNIKYASEQEILTVIGDPIAEDLVRVDGQPVDPQYPRHIVRTAGWIEWIDEDEEDVRLIDWGESFRHGEEPKRLAQPADSKAPETIFTETLDYRVDLWRAGIVIFHMVVGFKPFGASGPGDETLVSQMIHFNEYLPDEWKDRWLKMKEESGKSFDDTDLVPEISKLEERFDDLLEDPLDPPLRPLLPVIQGLMRFRPFDRLAASQALELLSESQ